MDEVLDEVVPTEDLKVLYSLIKASCPVNISMNTYYVSFGFQRLEYDSSGASCNRSQNINNINNELIANMNHQGTISRRLSHFL